MNPGTRLVAVGLIALMAVGSVVLWLGLPLGWLWLGSQMTDSTTPEMGPYALVAVGIPSSMVLFGWLLRRLNDVYGEVTSTTPTVRVRMPWHRSMRGESDGGPPRSVLDVVMVISVSAAFVTFGIWFAFFAGSSLPG